MSSKKSLYKSPHSEAEQNESQEDNDSENHLRNSTKNFSTITWTLCHDL
jgi:hypothetical protein